MAEGRSNAAIANELIVSEGAVEKHVANIFAKLDLPVSEKDHRRVLAVLRFLSRRGQTDAPCAWQRWPRETASARQAFSWQGLMPRGSQGPTEPALDRNVRLGDQLEASAITPPRSSSPAQEGDGLRWIVDGGACHHRTERRVPVRGIAGSLGTPGSDVRVRLVREGVAGEKPRFTRRPDPRSRVVPTSKCSGHS